MKKCKCGNEIREDQVICFDPCMKQIKASRDIAKDEIVFDIDNRDIGFKTINEIGVALAGAGYNFMIYYAEGQKSPHLHIKHIIGLDLLSKKALSEYKKEILKKYTPVYALKFVDLSLADKHLIAEEEMLHHKYGTPNRLLGAWNQDKENFCEPELYDIVKNRIEAQSFEYNPSKNPQGFGITAQIVQKINILDIASQFGLDIRANKALCPFHPDKNTPSLIFYPEQGRVCCFGCGFKGNIVHFYASLIVLKPKFKYVHQEVD